MNSTAPGSPASRYTGTAIALHWLMTLAIIGSLGVGWYMTDLSVSPWRLKLYNWHKWTGVTILTLAILRLTWRLTHRPPALPHHIERSMPSWQRIAHHWTHSLMYVLFFAVPLMGWAYSSMAGFQVVWFGVLPLPDFVPVNKELAQVIRPIHGWMAYTLLGFVVLHVGAAIKHHFIDRDRLISRMRPGRA